MDDKQKRILAIAIIAIIVLFIGGGICIGTCESEDGSSGDCGKLYCVHSDNYREYGGYYLGNCNTGSPEEGCKYNGISCDSSCLQCTWYPFACDVLACGFIGDILECDWLCHSMHPQLIVCGWDVCLGATVETGWEYQDAYDKLNEQKKEYFEPAVRDVDYTIDSVQILYDGGLLDTDKFWEINNFDFKDFVDKLKDQYLNLEFKSRFYVTVQYTVINDLAGIEFEQTLVTEQNSHFGLGGGHQSTYTRKAANGHSVSAILDNELDHADVLLPGKYATVIEFELDALDIHLESLSDLAITAYKLR